MDNDIEREINDSSSKVCEISYQLWQSLLTVNGFLITLLIGIAAFSIIKESWIKDLIFKTVVFLFVSSFCIILNFFITKQVFQQIYKFLYEAKMFDKMPNEKSNQLFASVLGVIKFISELLAIILQIVSWIMIIIFLHYVLFNG